MKIVHHLAYYSWMASVFIVISHHWSILWLGASWHQAITSTSHNMNCTHNSFTFLSRSWTASVTPENLRLWIGTKTKPSRLNTNKNKTATLCSVYSCIFLTKSVHIGIMVHSSCPYYFRLNYSSSFLFHNILVLSCNCANTISIKAQAKT